MRNLLLIFIMLFITISCGENNKSKNEASKKIENDIVQSKTEPLEVPEGLSLIKGSDCSACHFENQKLVGPSYKAIAEKYKVDNEAASKLITNILEGSNEVWGQIPMPAHPQLTENEVSAMVEYILSLKSSN